MDLTFTVPPDLSFEQAIAVAQDLLAAQHSDDVLEPAISALVASANGARGLFVTLLPGDFAIADRPTEGLLRGLRTQPDIVADLMTKNLAMSTAMELTHQCNQDADLATGSAKTKQRSIALIQALHLPQLQQHLGQLKASILEGQGNYAAFLDRWGYDPEQKSAILSAIETALS